MYDAVVSIIILICVIAIIYLSDNEEKKEDE